MATLFMFGDSITHGAWDGEGGGWAVRLHTQLMKSNEAGKTELVPYVLGIDGDTTTDLLARFENEVGVRQRHSGPSHVIFDIGCNDSIWDLQTGALRTPPETFRTQYAALINHAKALGGQVLCLGPISVDDSRTQPMPWSPQESYKMEYVRQYDEMIAQCATDAEVEYLSLLDVVDVATLPDGVHPGPAGHQAMYRRLHQKLAAMGLL